MATAPARQLNSKKIRSAIVSKIIPIVEGSCSIISAKTTYSTSDADRRRHSVDKLWLQICQKRDECDEVLRKISGVAFFFSSVAVLERKKEDEEQSAEEPEAENQDDPDAENSNRKKCFWPAISYWIAMQSRNGLRVSTVPFHSALLETGLEVTAKSLPECKKGREEQSASPLCTTVKDHNNYFLQTKVDKSFEHGMELLRDQILADPTAADMLGTERVVRLQVISPNFTSVLRAKAIPALVRAGLQFDVFGLEMDANEPKPSKALASPIVVLMNDVETAMAKLGYALHKGEVFKRCPTAKYSYTYCCSVKKFLSLLSNNDYFKDSLIIHFAKLESILSDPECEFMKQISIIYDLIEVSGGWCFSVSKRHFVNGAIKDDHVGKETPRAFVHFNHDKDPDPGYFRKILENSLSQSEIECFCEYYMRLLNCGIKQHKEKVLCLFGQTNSGKTSLFTPMTKIIPARYIAMITKQRAFNKSLIDTSTQVIFLDEAYAGLLDVDDWKLLTQGGLTAHDRKYKSSSPITIRCPMFITCQQEMDFGEADNAAMDVRLRKFNLKTLDSPPLPGVQKWLHDHAMDCIVWASTMAVTPVDELPPPDPATVVEDNVIDEDERERIRTLGMEESEEEEVKEPNVSEELSSQENDDDDEDDHSGLSYSSNLEKTLNGIALLRDEQPRHSIKHRQLELLGAGVRRFIDDCDCVEAQRKASLLKETKCRWISLGMLKESDAHLLTSVGGPYHPLIERTRDEYFARKKEEEMRTLTTKALEYYKDEWILAKEKDLWDLQRQKDAATESDTKRAIGYLMGVAVDALKAHFLQNSIPGLEQLVLEERKKKVVEMGLISQAQAQTLEKIWQLLPLPIPLSQTLEEPEDGDEESEEEDIFRTPPPSPTTNKSPIQIRDESDGETDGFLINQAHVHKRPQGNNKRKKPQVKQVKKSRNPITAFFSYSQQ